MEYPTSPPFVTPVSVPVDTEGNLTGPTKQEEEGITGTCIDKIDVETETGWTFLTVFRSRSVVALVTNIPLSRTGGKRPGKGRVLDVGTGLCLHGVAVLLLVHSFPPRVLPTRVPAHSGGAG